VVLDVKTQAFVEAAMLRGETSLYILFQEVLPNILPTLAVEASMRFTYAIFMVASLGFLGLGVQPPSADWGLMVGEAREWFRRAPWMLLFPAGAIALLVVGLSFLSDGLRRTLLPGGVSLE
jgi:peptide/nickel transport system permease protein